MSLSFREDRVRVVGFFKARPNFTPEEVRTKALEMIATVKAFSIMQKNLLKYDVSFISNGSGGLVKALGLRETEFCAMFVLEFGSHEQMHETLTDPEYLKHLDSALQTITSREDLHLFPAEFLTVIDQ
ncbi:hypothetical protein DFH07DRAFT_1063077 [Mycena maculata]|uniref:Stress-response A/B barrel domain-containing protein n=1 Tax=Mycena maculata TaxID=230809 RepID=A0AAD7INK6_9AGAR|nr:hypothetical protein DFH07DRAFT_1063077 [Mycena maculata]